MGLSYWHTLHANTNRPQGSIDEQGHRLKGYGQYSRAGPLYIQHFQKGSRWMKPQHIASSVGGGGDTPGSAQM